MLDDEVVLVVKLFCEAAVAMIKVVCEFVVLPVVLSRLFAVLLLLVLADVRQIEFGLLPLALEVSLPMTGPQVWRSKCELALDEGSG